MKSIRRETPLFLLGMVIFMLGLWAFPRLTQQESEPFQEVFEEEDELIPQGSIEPFLEKDMWIISNEAQRSSENLLKYFNARRPELQILYFKEIPRKVRKNLSTFTVGIYMRIDREGVLDSVDVSFSESNSSKFALACARHIQKYWRYKKARAPTEVILSIRFREESPKGRGRYIRSK